MKETLKAAAHPPDGLPLRDASGILSYESVHSSCSPTSTAVRSSTERESVPLHSYALRRACLLSPRAQKLLGCQSDRPAFPSLAAPSFPSRPSCPQHPKRVTRPFTLSHVSPKILKKTQSKEGKRERQRAKEGVIWIGRCSIPLVPADLVEQVVLVLLCVRLPHRPQTLLHLPHLISP